MLMVTFMMEIGTMIRQMVLEFIFMLMEQDTKEIGRRIFKTDMAMKAGQMEVVTKVTTKMVKNQE